MLIGLMWLMVCLMIVLPDYWMRRKESLVAGSIVI